MNDEINRPKAEFQPHAKADIFGRTEKNLKHNERLQFMTDEELAYLKDRFGNSSGGLFYADQKEWPEGFKALNVYNVFVAGSRAASKPQIVPGVLLTFGQHIKGANPFAVLDCGLKGVVHRPYELISSMTKEMAEERIPKHRRRHGRRIVRAMRDIDSVPGCEDKTLLRIVNNWEGTKRFHGYVMGTVGANGYSSIMESGLADWPIIKDAISFTQIAAKVHKMPDGELVGERCAQILMAAGVHPGNLYHGMYDLLRETIRLLKEVERVAPAFQKMHQAHINNYGLPYGQSGSGLRENY